MVYILNEVATNISSFQFLCPDWCKYRWTSLKIFGANIYNLKRALWSILEL